MLAWFVFGQTLLVGRLTDRIRSPSSTLPGLGTMLCTENGNTGDRKRLADIVGSNYGHSLKMSSQVLQGYNNLDYDSDSESNAQTSDDDASSQGSSDKMDDPVWFSDGGRRELSSSSMKALEGAIGEVLESVRAAGYGEAVCTACRDHFASLPSRYALNIDPQRHEDVLLHMELLQEAREVDCRSSYSSHDDDPPFVTPLVHVRKVQFPSEGAQSGRRDQVQLPRPTFGSNSNLMGLMIGNSPKVHPSSKPLQAFNSKSSPPKYASSNGSPSPGGVYGNQHSIPHQASGMFVNPLHMDAAAADGGDTDLSPSFGYEVTVATTDKLGLLKDLASAISDLHLHLNIQEAHVFSTTDGMTLHVFVVNGWPGDEAEDLRKAILGAIDENLGRKCGTSRNQLRAAVEAIKYEDWSIEFDQLHIGEKLGAGSTGQLFKGKYLSQEVAIKIIEIDDCNGSGTDGDTHRSAPAAERLQIYKQEISIMRLVRHKNVVQFIGACSKWPQLCIVTELMAGGSVRDVLESRKSGLDFATAIKVLRDAARGMDFLHKRGIVHRDLKAANLLIDEYEVVKVCDFGVARLKPQSLNAAGKSEKYSTEMTAETGTYRWMSPEVLEHKPYNHKADVYSFAITMWEVFTGEVPYSGLSPLQAAIGVVQRGLRPKLPRSQIPESLATLMQQCWHLEPRKRPEFCEVLGILENIVSRTPAKRGTYSTWKYDTTFRN